MIILIKHAVCAACDPGVVKINVAIRISPKAISQKEIKRFVTFDILTSLYAM